MKVFISVRVPREDTLLKELSQLVYFCTRHAGHTPFLAYQEICNQGWSDSKSFMPFVRQHILSSDLVIILYSSDLRGGLIEEGIAYAADVPICLVHRAGERVSSSALGCANFIVEYRDSEDLASQLSHLFCSADTKTIQPHS